MNQIFIIVSLLISFFSCSIIETAMGKREKDPTDDLKILGLAQIALVPPCKIGVVTESAVWLNPGHAHYYTSPYIGKLIDGTNFCLGYSLSDRSGVFATFDYPEPGNYKIQIFNEIEGPSRRTIGGIFKQDIETLTSIQFNNFQEKLLLIPFDYQSPFDTLPPVCVATRGIGQSVCIDTASTENLKRSLFLTSFNTSSGGYTVTCKGSGCPTGPDNKGRIVITKEK
ncbi:hypothetical protein [Leptospira stimsonii]|uniref:Uncharacterized protein n=1 Tax=Leptospira stimsonii TaxID=2202203 RepID=A0A8B6RYU3_9LEPT|nr:hypothetical protein [Leptospira stimsonii]RHX86802.1 hypothetical protein DLM78_08500 [Leptospira stimsonii]